MARLIRHEATGPHEIKASSESTWICMCGLSQNYPLCDGHHKLCRKQEQPGKLYRYEGETAIEIEEK
ncbi:MAG: CDGSH iron-sulfur domain-containing protein [Planctomycetes bacterium]|nr:CDGSH iron-sulfur domain-containing protein [Planctomycetota bacterium]